MENWKHYCINNITDLIIRLNGASHASTSIQIRLKDAQLKSFITDLIFDCELHSMSWIKPQAQKNVSFNALVISKAVDISMAIDQIDRSSWRVFLLDIVPDARQKQIIFIRELIADTDIWSIGKVNKIYHHIIHVKGILVNYCPGFNDNGTIRWQNTGRSIPADCCKVAILDKDSKTRS
ncbi:hypothetical protein RhiirC2_799037 [Rhizophagus irregularis]|uniref:Uncharacterized protein n=1 Tax=Rhizophagus irregularis TaxID=588596 RepID=A0A2N1M5N8_9GLOM|nr:hypothetical protein RhiirC2_799037 [Rhizophagus irregularis]